MTVAFTLSIASVLSLLTNSKSLIEHTKSPYPSILTVSISSSPSFLSSS